MFPNGWLSRCAFGFIWKLSRLSRTCLEHAHLQAAEGGFGAAKHPSQNPCAANPELSSRRAGQPPNSGGRLQPGRGRLRDYYRGLNNYLYHSGGSLL